jgi:hypothetical protein
MKKKTFSSSIKTKIHIAQRDSFSSLMLLRCYRIVYPIDIVISHYAMRQVGIYIQA